MIKYVKICEIKYSPFNRKLLETKSSLAEINLSFHSENM